MPDYVKTIGLEDVQKFINKTSKGVSTLKKSMDELSYEAAHVIGQIIVNAIQTEHPSENVREHAAYEVLQMGGASVVNIFGDYPKGEFNHWIMNEQGAEWSARSRDKPLFWAWPEDPNNPGGEWVYTQTLESKSFTQNKGKIRQIINSTGPQQIAIYLSMQAVSSVLENLVRESTGGKVTGRITSGALGLLSGAGVSPSQLAAMAPGFKSARINPLTGGLQIVGPVKGQIMKTPSALRGIRIK